MARTAIRRGLKATMQDVAREAGVSWITVSRALREPGVVTDATRLKINAAIETIGYLPHITARTLASQRSQVVVAIVPAMNNPVYAETLRGLADGLRARGMQLMIGNSDYDADEEERLITAFLARRPDGIVLTGTTHTRLAQRLLRRSGIPVVETWSATRRSSIDMRVGFDNRAAQAAMARHLIGAGYRRFAYATGPLIGQDRWRERLEGFRSSLAEAGLSMPDSHLFPLPGTIENGMHVVRQIRGAGLAVDALVCAGDVYAIGAVLECNRQGIRVPDDLAIAGFGDFGLGALLKPSLTTISIPSHDIGSVAASLILERLDGVAGARRIVDLGYRLVIREST